MVAHHDYNRGIEKRIHINGTLRLLTPAHFGVGEVRGETLVDMSLLLDEVDQQALIPGTTIAGALRNYLRERLYGYSADEPDDKTSRIAWLFGPPRMSNEDLPQSTLIVEDARAAEYTTTLRDGVRIDPATGTAYVEERLVEGEDIRTEGAKFDIELLQAGAEFDLHFEVLVTRKRKAGELLPYLAAALEGFERGEIRLGARKHRGYGKCQVIEWTVSKYDLTEPRDLCAWLDTPTLKHRPEAHTGKIADVLTAPVTRDVRSRFTMRATFGLDGSSLLIRSGFGQSDVGPDMEHLHAVDPGGQRRPIVPGTSWAGVIRHRALRIANTIASDGADQNRAAELVKDLFGWMPDTEEDIRASKVVVDETEVKHGRSLYQTRVRIDRFTGGAFETALFEQAPVYGTEDTRVDFWLEARDPRQFEIGLLVLVLKDLWTGDLPVGGEASVGRGRLQGLEAILEMPDGVVLKLQQNEAGLGLNDEQRQTLQTYVDALHDELGGQEEAANGAT